MIPFIIQSKINKLIWLTFFVSTIMQAQDNVYDYHSEWIYAINKNTSGGLIGGFSLKKTIRINEKIFKSYGLEVVNIKHPQEIQNRSSTAESYIYGKVNYLYGLRFQYGKELILFKKAPQKGVEIKVLGSFGPSIGMITPYYIKLRTANSQFNQNTVHQAYDPHNPLHNPNNIMSSGYLFEGLGKSRLAIGANLKTGISFEFGSIKNSLSGLELGFLLDVYHKRIELLAGTKNRFFFPTAYISLFFGLRN